MGACLLVRTAWFGASVFADLCVFVAFFAFALAVALTIALSGGACFAIAVTGLGALATEHNARKKCSTEQGFETVVHRKSPEVICVLSSPDPVQPTSAFGITDHRIDWTQSQLIPDVLGGLDRVFVTVF